MAQPGLRGGPAEPLPASTTKPKSFSLKSIPVVRRATYASSTFSARIEPGVVAAAGIDCANVPSSWICSPKKLAFPFMILKPLSGAGLWLPVIITPPSVSR